MDIRKGTRLIDRPEFKSKPIPITFLKKDKVFQAIEIMSEKNYGSSLTALDTSFVSTCSLEKAGSCDNEELSPLGEFRFLIWTFCIPFLSIILTTLLIHFICIAIFRILITKTQSTIEWKLSII